MASEQVALDRYLEKHSTCDVQKHPWPAVFGAGFDAGLGEQATRIAALEAENRRLVEALLEVALRIDTEDLQACWCVRVGSGRHDEGCSKARAALAAAGTPGDRGEGADG